jgi:hypothetical protein
MLAVDLSHVAYIVLRYYLSIPSFLIAFIMKEWIMSCLQVPWVSQCQSKDHLSKWYLTIALQDTGSKKLSCPILASHFALSFRLMGGVGLSYIWSPILPQRLVAYFVVETLASPSHGEASTGTANHFPIYQVTFMLCCTSQLLYSFFFILCALPVFRSSECSLFCVTLTLLIHRGR